MPHRLLLLVLSAGLSNVAAAQEPELPLLTAARKREEATRSVEFVVQSKRTIPRGGLSRENNPGFEPQPIEPEADRQVESTARLVYNGVRGRWEDNGPVGPRWNSPIKWLLTQNDREARTTVDQRSNNSEHIGGRVDRPYLVSGTANLPAPEPILFACRLSQLIKDKTKIEPTGKTAVIDGAVCEGYRIRGQEVVWADPKQDYVIRRIEGSGVSKYSVDGTHSVRQDIRYERHPVAGWWPASWTVTDQHKSGRVAYTITATATMTHVGEKFADDLFESKFPVGTEVSDSTRKNPYVPYVVGPNGEELPPKQLPAVPLNIPSKPWNQYQWVGVGMVALGIVLTVLAIGRKLQLRHRNRGAIGGANFAA